MSMTTRRATTKKRLAATMTKTTLMTTRTTTTIASTTTNSVLDADARRTLAQKQQRLQDILSGYRSVLIAFSGGVDSAYLAIAAAAALGDRALAVTADSAS